MTYGHQREDLAAARDVPFLHDAEAGAVDLHRDHVRLQPGPFEAAQGPLDGAVGNLRLEATLDQPRLVFGMTPVELLPEGVGRTRVRRHDDPSDGTLLARLPGPLVAVDVALLVVRRGCLAEVPDVAPGVGGIPVMGRLGQRPVDAP